MKTTGFFLFIILLSISRLLATDENANAVFFDSVATAYLHEYKSCTGYKGNVDKKDLLDWKTHMLTVAQSPEYAVLLAEYKKNVDSTNTPLPCIVLTWDTERKKVQTHSEDTLIRTTLTHEEESSADSETAYFTKSKYDIKGIPFGIAKKNVLFLFKREFGLSLIDMGNSAYTYSQKWGSRPFLTALYFDKKTGQFIRYEIESQAYGADDLNTSVRSDAEYLAAELSKTFGEISRKNTIGFFDIKSGMLSPYVLWNVENGSASVGIGMNKYRYYAKAIVYVYPKAISASDSLKATTKPAP